ncbi:Nuclear distribution protein PAC1 [Diplonema papillatum]|nr:Nuclear distribution protein PAC1 [Diplonema papillatum]
MLEELAGQPDSLRKARRRRAVARDVQRELLVVLQDIVDGIDMEIPLTETRLLAMLKSVLKSDGDSKQERVACRDLECELDELIDRRMVATSLHDELQLRLPIETCNARALAHLERALVGLSSADPNEFLTRSHSRQLLELLDTGDPVHAAECSLVRTAVQMTFEVGVSALCVDPEQPAFVFVGLTDGKLLRASIAAGTVDRLFPGHYYEILALCATTVRETRCLISCCRDKTVRVVNVQTQEVLHCLSHHSGCVIGVAVVRDVLYTASLDGTVGIWQLQHGVHSGSLVRTPEKISAAIFLTGSVFLGTKTGCVMELPFVDQPSKPVVPSKTWKAHTAALRCIAETHGFLLTGGDDCVVSIWDTAADGYPLVRTMRHHVDSVLQLAVAPDHGLVFSAGADAVVVVWDLKTGDRLRVVSEHFHHVTVIALLRVPLSQPGEPPGPEKSGQPFSQLRALLALPDDMFVGGEEQSARNEVRVGKPPSRPPRQNSAAEDVSMWEAPSSVDEADLPQSRASPASRAHRHPAVPPLKPPQDAPALFPCETETAVQYLLVSASTDKSLLVWNASFSRPSSSPL